MTTERRSDLRALTVHQPYAGLIVAGRKDVENRKWFRLSIVGLPILIHASRRLPEGTELVERVEGDDVHGAIIGAATVANVVDDSLSPWAVKDRWHWVLTDAVRFAKPVVCRGYQSLWTPEPDIMQACLRQL